MTTPPLRKIVWTVVISAIIPAFIYFTPIVHEAWGDERYELKEDALQKEKQLIRKEIAVIDRELGLLEQEIIFAESENQTKKYEAMKALYENEKTALKEVLEDKG